MTSPAQRNPERFRHFAYGISESMGTPWAFLTALAIVLLWAVTGPLFHFDDHWQLIINTGTTVVTFLMVFVIQTTQNRDSKALHLKLDELIRSQKKARNLFADLEHASEDELRRFTEEFRRLREADEKRPGLDAAADAVEHVIKRHHHPPMP